MIPRLRLATVFAAAVLLLSTLGATALDRDSNGMSDVWEAAYGKGRVAAADDDGDGQSNLAESWAGTNPADSKSVHHIQTLSEDGDVLHLEWAAQAGKQYQVQVNGSLDAAGWRDVTEAQTGDGSTMKVDLPLSTIFFTGEVKRSVWRGLGIEAGWRLDIVQGYVSSGTPAPSEEGTLSVLDVPRDIDDQYAQWVRGWLIPPSTGDYTFWIAGDDKAELFLSTSSDPAEKASIASVPGWTNYKEWDKYPDDQQSAAVPLLANTAYYFEAFMTEGGGGDHLSVAWSGPGFARELISAPHLTIEPESLAQMGAGAGLFFRVVVSDIDSDGDGLTDYEELMAKLDPANPKSTPRVPDLTTLLAILSAKNVVTAGVAESRAYEIGETPARFAISRSGGMEPITIGYTISGVAMPNEDYQPLSGTVTLGPSENSATVVVRPLVDALVEPAESVTITLTPGADYEVGSPASATVTIDDAPDVLYVATLRGGTLPGEISGGYGYAALRVAGNKVFGTLGLQFGNLGTTQIDAEVFVAGAGGGVVLSLPVGQIAGRRWEFEPTASLSTAQILAALEGGQLRLRVRSEGFPQGEIEGAFLVNPGWQTMPIPPSVPTPPETLPGATATAKQAARFLTQTTFGPTISEIEALEAQGIDAWLDEQFAMPPTLHLPAMRARRQQYIDRSNGTEDGWQVPRHETWWQRSLTAPDQLRQRMAFALSEIFVVSELGSLESAHEGMANWYDMLLTNAFGNYRDLLEKVTLSPIMGQYLSMVRNRKPDPETGSEPDENFAREVMQLFSIGLSQLNLDGTLKLDAEGMPIPTYDQEDIVGLAHVFTGWGFGYTGTTAPNFFWGPQEEIMPMVQYPAYHDLGEKHLINGYVVPAGQTGEQDLEMALDLLAGHPNIAPFLSRQLIQRFVTSNPSPGYVYRVATVFNSSGGNLGATLRAILTDHEARDETASAKLTYGKLREPLIRYTHLLRAMNAAPPIPGDPSFYLSMQYGLTHQGPLRSPSVFNFFQPGYIPPGELAAAGLIAPEFQILSETTAVLQANLEHSLIHWGAWTPEVDPVSSANYVIRLNFDEELAILKDPGHTLAENMETLLDRLDLELLSGQMPPYLRQAIRDAWTALPGWYGTADEELRARARLATYVIFESPEYAVQK